MSIRQAFASALHLFIVFAAFAAGFLFVGLPYLPETRVKIIDLFSNQIEKCTMIGATLFVIALILLLGFYALDRGRFLVIEMGVFTDAKVIRQTVEECFSRQFPKKISLKEVEIGPKSHLTLKVGLASLDEAEREDLFVRIENELSLLLQRRFGYAKPFRLIVQTDYTRPKVI